jgi:hypothetical protein
MIYSSFKLRIHKLFIRATASACGAAMSWGLFCEFRRVSSSSFASKFLFVTPRDDFLDNKKRLGRPKKATSV